MKRKKEAIDYLIPILAALIIINLAMPIIIMIFFG